MNTEFNRTLTELDHVRLYNLLRRQGAGVAGADPLSTLIDAARLVRSQEVEPNIVTMVSKVRVADPDTGAEQTLSVCYPQDADASAGRISVLSPLGTALLGLRVGEIAEWRVADGQPGRLKVLSVEYQPEASGDYTA